ncbi:MAG: LamG domain-containing protein [Verrucomicrobiales bacterium]|nr:LamG domain-containing protein [Verrucomicrobiales bacterium]
MKLSPGYRNWAVRTTLLISLWLATPAQAQLPPQRSSRITGTSTAGLCYPTNNSIPVEMTAEAWVYREDDTRCETIVGQDFTRSFWLGLCSGKLRFYRSGGAAADADRGIPEKRWTHVAASYRSQGADRTVSFFIDGVPAGVKSLSNTGGNHALPIYVGRDQGNVLGLGATYPFLGGLDEVRVWAGARTLSQIQSNRFSEVTSDPDLRFRFSGEGPVETVSGEIPSVSIGVTPQTWGIVPRDLIIPTTTFSPTLDGEVGEATEYAGAEQVVYRELTPTGEIDTRAYLVASLNPTQSRITALWVGIASPGEAGSADAMAGGSIRLWTDANNSGGGSLGYRDFLLNYSHFADPPTATVFETTLLGTLAPSPLATSEYFRPSGAFCQGEFAPACAEFAIPWNSRALGESNQFGFMLQFLQPSKLPAVIPPVDWRSPLDASPTAPRTWARARIGSQVNTPSSFVTISLEAENFRAQSTLDRLIPLTVSVSDRRDSRELLQLQTSSLGISSFQFRVPRGAMLRFQIERQTEWEYRNAVHANTTAGVPATVLGQTEVDFPACDTSECHLRLTRFLVGRPPGPSDFDESASIGYQVRYVLRDGPPPLVIAGTGPVLEGTNLHNRMSVWANPGNSTIVPTGEMAEPPAGQGYVPLIIASIGSDGRTLNLEPSTQLRGNSADIWVRDNWTRTGMGRRWHYAGRATPTPAPYHQLHTFAFENVGDGHDIDDYRAAFPGLVCDPFKMVGFWAWFPIYLLALNDGGECVGLCTTSDQLARGRLNAGSLLPGVHYAAGFPVSPLKPARFNVDFERACAPLPINLWGQIRANHGAQLSSQFIMESLAQLRFDPIRTVMREQVAKLERRPKGWLMCIRYSPTASGHALVPLAVRPVGAFPNLREVEVYDPNHPGEVRVIQIDIDSDNFSYDGFARPWRGRLVVLHDIAEFWERQGRDLISVDTLGTAVDRLGARGLFDLIQMMVSGSALPLVTQPDGNQVGWQDDGSLIETITNGVTMPIFSHRDDNTLPFGRSPANLIFKPMPGGFTSKLQIKGSKFAVNLVNAGNMFQLFGDEKTAGDEDSFDATLLNGKVHGFRYKPQRASGNILPRIALAKDGTNYTALFSWRGLQLPGGGAAQFRALPDIDSVELVNETGRSLSPQLEVSGLDALPMYRTNLFASPRIPSGATQRLRVVGPDRQTLESQLDLNGDGLFDIRTHVGTGNDGGLELPALLSEFKGGKLNLSWPLRAEAWYLETVDSLKTGDAWSPVVASPTLLGGRQIVTVPAPDGNRFFRLRKLGTE